MLTSARFELRRLILEAMDDGQPAFMMDLVRLLADGDLYDRRHITIAVDELIENELIAPVMVEGFTKFRRIAGSPRDAHQEAATR